MRAGFALFFAIFFVVCLLGCSGGQLESITQPVNPNTAAAPMDEPAQRILFGIWEIGFDPASESVSIIPSRNIEAHFNITNYVTPPQCDDCLGITVEGFNPEGWVYDIKVTLQNPTPLTAYDVRGTLLIGAEGDNREIVNVDDYTELFDDTTPPDRNPFKVFATDQPGRVFLPDAIHEVLYQVSIPPPPNFNVTFVIDGSWPNNQKDPYEIYNQEITGEFFDNGSGTADVVAYVKDWQMDVDWVKLDVTPLGAPGKIDLEHQAGIKWEGLINNEFLAPAGDYDLWLEAKSQNNAQILYDKIDLTISAYVNTPPVWDDTIGIVSAIPGNEEVLVNYGTASDPDEPVTYNIYCSSVSPIDFDASESQNDTDGSPFLYEGLINGQTYYFAVRAMDGAGLEDNNQVVKFTKPKESLGWAKTWGGIGKDQAYALTIDSDNNIYVTGVFQDVVDFDPGPGASEYSANGNRDVFLSKFNSSGEFQWVNIWGAQHATDSSGIGIDKDDNIYVTGHFNSIADFDPGPGTDIHVSNGSFDVYVVKFNALGDFLWARTWGGDNWDYGYAISVDDIGNAYITGIFNGVADFDPGPEVDEHASNGQFDIFISKLNSEGDFQWAYAWGGESYDWGRSVVVDDYGNVYFTGSFSGSVDFDPGPGVDEHSSNAVLDVFLSKYSSDGTFQWVLTWGGDSNDAGCDITTDVVGNIYVTGYYYGPFDFDPGPDIDEHISVGGWDIFMSSFNPSGDFRWARTWGGKDNDQGLGIVAANTDEVFVTGYFEDVVDFDPTIGIVERISSGESDVFVSRFNSNGAFQWVCTWGGIVNDWGRSACIDSSGNVYVTGVYKDSVDFDSSIWIDEHTSNGDIDIFLCKFPPDGDW